MNVYLVRHAHAVEAEADAARPLSKRGEGQVEALAHFLRRSDAFAPAEFWHSSLVRSQQTASLLAKRLRLDVPLTQMPDLEPEDDPRAAARRIKALSHPLAIVGHEPHLSALATLLVVGDADAPAFVMKKSAVLALEGAGPHWRVRWHVSPEVIA